MGGKNYHHYRPILAINKNKGITLIEVVFSMAIIGIFAVLIISSFQPTIQIAKANDGRRKSDLKKISIALEDYVNDSPCYPEEIYDGDNCRPSAEFSHYLPNIPCDPRTKKPYPYVRPDNCEKYVLFAEMERENSLRYERGNYAISSSNYRVEPITITPTSVSEPEPIVTPTVTGIPTPTLTPIPGDGDYFGCINGQCQPLEGPVCLPNFDRDDCYWQCGTIDHPLSQCH